MKRLLRIAGLVAALVLVLGAGRFAYFAFKQPGEQPLPLPESLIALNTPAGQQLLSGSTLTADYAALGGRFETQSRAGFCGVASSVMVLNALAPGAAPLTQATFFDDAASRARSSLQVTFGGMTLEQLGALLNARGAQAAVHFASVSSLAAFRAAAQRNLGDGSDFLLVNYQRSAIGQKPGGHISPVAAYNAQADRFLVLDVARYKYPPVWVPAEALFQAMNAVDSASGRTRGFVEVRK